MSLLHDFAIAVEDDDLSMVESLISRGLVDVNARLTRAFKPPALVHAALRCRDEIVDILLRANARIDDTDERGRTACHFAAQFGRHIALALLLARQPNLAIVDTYGQTALCCAARYSRDDGGRCALMLLEAGASLESVSDLCALAATSTAAIQALINRGVIVRELVDDKGSTPLHHARDAAVLDMLVNVCGIDLESRNCHGSTSILFAAANENEVSLRWLIEIGADVNVANNARKTPLHRVHSRKCTVLLLAAGANVFARDSNGWTALHRCDLTAVHSLLAAGADVLDVVENDGKTVGQVLAHRGVIIEPDEVEAARREIAKTRVDFVRNRALQVCIGLQLLELDALQMCEILQFACGPVAPLVPFHGRLRPQ